VALLLGGAAAVVLRRGREEPAPVESKPVASAPGVVELEPFVLNLADPAGDRYFRLVLRLVLDRRAVAERASDGLARSRLRDRILSVLSKQRAGELTTTEGRESLRAELSSASEACLAEAPFLADGDAPARVLEVYFTEFLVQ
jgi:flagellar FliL protein